jgi:repressor LexA
MNCKTDMATPKAPLLECLCDYALSIGAEAIEVEYKDGRDWVFAYTGATGIGIASYKSASAEAKQLRRSLYAAAKKAFHTVLGGQSYILKVRIRESFGEDLFAVSLRAGPKPKPSDPPGFTAKQGQYLAFIYHYTVVHRQSPAERDLEHYFRVSPPSIHNMILTLERNGFIERTPGQARSIRLLVPPEKLPPLG